MDRGIPTGGVLESFGLQPPISPTRSADVWKVGPVALKRVDHHAATEWWCELVAHRDATAGFRIPAPLAAGDGRWVVDGWAASTWIAGHEAGSRWTEILEVADQFHRWMSDTDRPGWLDEVDDPWSAADRMAWGEQRVDVIPAFVPLVAKLQTMLQPIESVSQLVHGDLTGNVLFADGVPPGIIDFSLYWRPAGYASAIVAVDCFEWEGVGTDVLDHVAGLRHGDQLLVRAALFRMIRAGMVAWSNIVERLAVHARTVANIEARLR